MIKEGEYKGRPTVSLLKTPDDEYPFSFGLKKAKLILENIDEIAAFVQKHDSGETTVDE